MWNIFKEREPNKNGQITITAIISMTNSRVIYSQTKRSMNQNFNNTNGSQGAKEWPSTFQIEVCFQVKFNQLCTNQYWTVWGYWQKSICLDHFVSFCTSIFYFYFSLYHFLFAVSFESTPTPFNSYFQALRLKIEKFKSSTLQ